MVIRAFERDSLFSIITGPMIWVAHFLTVYIFTAIACARGFFYAELLGVRVVPLVGGVATVAAAALIVDAFVVSWRRWRGGGAAGSLPPHDRTGVDSRRRFMAFSGILLCGASLIATLWEALPVVFFASCR